MSLQFLTQPKTCTKLGRRLHFPTTYSPGLDWWSLLLPQAGIQRIVISHRTRLLGILVPLSFRGATVSSTRDQNVCVPSVYQSSVLGSPRRSAWQEYNGIMFRSLKRFSMHTSNSFSVTYRPRKTLTHASVCVAVGQNNCILIMRDGAVNLEHTQSKWCVSGHSCNGNLRTSRGKIGLKGTLARMKR